jgi:hypothetical protein
VLQEDLQGYLVTVSKAWAWLVQCSYSMLIDDYTKCAVGWSQVAAHCLVEIPVVAYINKAWGFIRGIGWRGQKS